MTDKFDDTAQLRREAAILLVTLILKLFGGGIDHAAFGIIIRNTDDYRVAFIGRKTELNFVTVAHSLCTSSWAQA
jgi:hypothetical protein